jgi:hypothetical protein
MKISPRKDHTTRRRGRQRPVLAQPAKTALFVGGNRGNVRQNCRRQFWPFN